MHRLFRLAAASLTTILCLAGPGPAAAQSAATSSGGDCPALPPDSGLTWRTLDGPDFVFCKAIRDSDQAEVFAVTISRKSPFAPSRSDREEEATIDGHQAYWYRAEIAGKPELEVRETLVELDDGRVAHISLRANSQAELTALQQEAANLRFATPQLSSK